MNICLCFNQTNSKIEIKATVIANNGGILIENKNGECITLSINGSPLQYNLNANTVIGQAQNPPAKEQPFCAFGSDGQAHYLRVLTNGQVYAPFEIAAGVTISGTIQYLAKS